MDKKNRKNENVLRPNIPKYMESFTFTDRNIYTEDVFQLRVIENEVIEHQTAEKVCFDQIIFKNVTFDQITFHKLELTDVIFEKCDLSNIDLSDAIMHRVEMNDCKILGLNLLGSTLRNVLFHNCYADFATFRFANCKQVKFENTSLCNADFYRSELTKVELCESNLDQAQMSGTKLAGIDVSSCRFDGLGATLEDLQGCIISPEQAVVLSRTFGLIIKEIET
ncbi:pentapeptide repeat-containing protein [Paenibacillus sp. MER TA 81-3]|uniref:pentapeptide repeat-containing protein n=1 Tax=Paenibacillus sp. MER TA 81-3 TaxID=2939573 RepID=UPI00203E209E|nr:pentapeptide repeat-containing protein [Paenibacillus sp. MER TA 81-3]MCM3338128.1 pentapeptide repeat-containing protein [Paenibacillus sp. MER TA 81-3]